MRAEDLLREGNLSGALADLQDRVRSDPGNAGLRVFLCQLLAVLGEWERAMGQLKVAGDLDPKAIGMAQVYREAIRSEALRADIFAGKRSPVVFGQPDPWVALLIEALRADAEGRPQQAEDLRAQAFESAPPTSGAAFIAAGRGGKGESEPPEARHDFEWIADADSRLGPVLEAVVNGRYCWVPFDRIREVRIEAPTDLRDLVWAPATFTWPNGGEAVGLVPVRYPGSESVDDDAIRLSRRTEWSEPHPGSYVGHGQRIFATDDGEFAILEVRRLTLDVESPESAPAGGAADG